MSKWEKWLFSVRNNPKQVRFQDIETFLLRLGFNKRQDGTSHAVFTYLSYRLTIPKPHGTSFVKEVYIIKIFLPAIEATGLLEEEE